MTDSFVIKVSVDDNDNAYGTVTLFDVNGEDVARLTDRGLVRVCMFALTLDDNDLDFGR